MERCKGNIASLRYITPSVSLQHQIKKDWGRVCTCQVNWNSVVLLLGSLWVGNEHGDTLGAGDFSCRFQPILYTVVTGAKASGPHRYCFDRLELITQARFHRLSPEFGRDGVGFATCGFGIQQKNSQFTAVTKASFRTQAREKYLCYPGYTENRVVLHLDIKKNKLLVQ